ncbi:MAG TPA: squalene/phytoene synthase family protein [Anaerolineaceae bacterium]|jgi:phytoene/squalene synthetase
MKPVLVCSDVLAAEITRSSSAQTYFTIRFLADRTLVPDAYRAYAYFRWVDDILDAETGAPVERSAFIRRQQLLLEACYRGQDFGNACAEEQMLVDLVAHDREPGSGLQSYLRNMMAVMAFDVERRGRLISQVELATYSRQLSTAVTDALHYFIGRGCAPTRADARYLPVQGAHIIHMLRDWSEDRAAGYFNLPRESVEAHGLSFQDETDLAFRQWVRGRVNLAQAYFQAGREYLAGVRSLRLRLACFAYIARFEWMARAIALDGYRLRPAYPERKSARACAWMVWRTLSSVCGLCRPSPVRAICS